MSETRPSMLRSCRVWLESRRDIPGDKLACMTALIGRAAERETVRVGRNARCPACGGKIPLASKFCMHCGQRVKITEIAEKSGQRHMPYSTAELERAVELHRSGLTWAQVGAEMGRSKEAIRSSASRYMRIKAANERSPVQCCGTTGMQIVFSKSLHPISVFMQNTASGAASTSKGA